MQNIQDLQENIFLEFKNIINNLEKINNVEELVSKQDLVNKLAERVSFLKLLQENIEYYQFTSESLANAHTSYYQEQENLVFEEIEEEVIFNNLLNEVGDFGLQNEDLDEEVEEEVIFNNQLNEISEDDENDLEDEQTSELVENDLSEEERSVLSFIDEDRILEDSEPEDEEFEEIDYNDTETQEEVIFNNQLNEIEQDDSDEELEEISFSVEESFNINEEEFEDEINKEDEISHDIVNLHDDEMATDYSSLDHIVSEIKEEGIEEELAEENQTSTENIVNNAKDIDKENLEHDKKIKLSHIKKFNEGQVSHYAEEIPTPQQPTFTEAEKPKPEFRLDLNDRMAFTKVLFGGSQSDLNLAISELNRCHNLEEAKEYLSDLYYDRNWEKVDEYAQRLWFLVENKFL